MRYGLLALSIAMLTSGGVAAQSALNISHSAQAIVTQAPGAKADRGAGYGSLPFTAARTQSLR
ncbi:MAG: hypothetical protein K2Y17_01410 [Qipengyuania sp.]|jgi:hypothetical protein|nr:hypothetical protein [Qipengyuania sp.]